MLEELQKALEAANISIIKYDKSRQRPVSTSRGTMNVEKFCKIFLTSLGSKGAEFPEVFKTIHDVGLTTEMLIEYARENKILRGDKVVVEIPPEFDGLTLNLDLTAKALEDRFFLTHPDESVSEISGSNYLLIHQVSALEAVNGARKVIPKYLPRSPIGVTEVMVDGKSKTIFNTYVPPRWKKVDQKKLLPTLPPLFEKLVKHLFPKKIEQEYFFNWLYESLFNRAYVFLVLCGAPGTGKNRLKLVLRALHGHVNTVDGKRSTLTDKFNSQLSGATLAWFDELSFGPDLENTMKELQNDSISIERKGVDATKATRIYTSIVISNNKPRDNHITFDGRKFVPLVITSKRLEERMLPKEIDTLTKKVEDEDSKTFDIEFLAQIVKWVKKYGKSDKWPNLEYKGPMFWALAHTSMSRWQKKVVNTMMMSDIKSEKWGYNPDTGYHLWSVIEHKLGKKNGDRSLQMPDFSTVKAFFDAFRDSRGFKTFETKSILGGSVMGDFYVKMTVDKLSIITEGTVLSDREKRGTTNVKTKKIKKDSDYL